MVTITKVIDRENMFAVNSEINEFFGHIRKTSEQDPWKDNPNAWIFSPSPYTPLHVEDMLFIAAKIRELQKSTS